MHEYTDPSYTSFREIFWGLLLLVGTIFLHAQAMLFTITVYRREPAGHIEHPSRGLTMISLLTVGSLLGLSHMIDVTLWASFFKASGCFANFSTSFYVALANYTTVGCDINFPRGWLLLGPMASAAGLLMFSWSAAILLIVAQRYRDG